MRASAACESAGVPTSSLVSEGFVRQAAATCVGLGLPNLQVAKVKGHPGAQSAEELRRNILDATIEQVIANLTQMPAAAKELQEPGAHEIVFRGGFDAVNRFFYQHEYSDGLPIVPPTREKLESFLRHSDGDPDELLGVAMPDNRAATRWSIAVNGVMAGCRPEYMPVLVALVEAMLDPDYGNEHSGNSQGGETLIVLNGPVIKELEFNYVQGVLRDGYQANSSVGRFLRLYLRNVAGFLPQKTDKATYGNNWRVAAAENEDALKSIGWEPNSVEMGYAAGSNTVTIARYTGGNVISSVSGGTPEEMLPYLADALVRQTSWQLLYTVAHGGRLRPLLVLSPIIAETIAKAGWSKADVKRYLFDHARMPAHQFERMQRWAARPAWNLAEQVRLGNIPAMFHESNDPDRMVPLVWKPDDFMILVTGDPLRNNAYAFGHNGTCGYPVAREVKLPKEWKQLLAARG